MNLSAEKLQLVRLLIETEDKGILKKIKAIFEPTTIETDIWDEWDDEVKADVLKSIEELDRGEGIPHQEVMRDFAKWRKK